jgi:tetratricopeptide (TPR) repeat protein
MSIACHPLSTVRALAVAAGLLCAAAVGAQTLKDPALEALYVADKADELQRAAQQRLAHQPEDVQAVLALALAALDRNDTPARKQALERAEACAQKQPKAAPCRYAHGVLLGIQAVAEGLMKAARSAGTVKDALLAAHELEPAWYPARSALLEFYLAAPGFMGGSASKAAELARGAPRPEQVAALQARVAMQDKRFDTALAALAALPPGLEHALATDVQGWGTQAALGAVNAGQAAQAQPFFERLMRDRPGHAAGAYGLARVRGELGDWAGALRLYEQAQGLKDAADWPLAYRMGIALQQLGRTDEAKAAYKRFVTAGKGQKASLDDARKRLEQLGG